MKKALLMLLIIIVLGCFITSCKKTPDEIVVKSKKEDTYIDIIKSDENNDILNEPNISVFSAPESWKDELVSKVRKVNVKIDAKVQIPITDKYPVFKIEPSKITQEQSDYFISSIFNNIALYQHDSRSLVTKSEYEEAILNLKKHLSQDLNDIKDEENREKIRKDIQAHIDEYSKRLNTAPETRDIIISEPIFSNETLIKVKQSEGLDPSASKEEKEEWDKGIQAEVEAIKKSNTEAISFDGKINNDIVWVDIQRSDIRYKNHFNYISSRYKKGIFNNSTSDIKGLNITYEEAKRKAEQIVSYLGADYMKISLSATYSTKSMKYVKQEDKYAFYFTRRFDNLCETYVSNYVSFSEYDEPWGYEYIVVIVDEKGIVAVNWENCSSVVTQTITENAPLLPFESIIELANQQIEIDNMEYKLLHDAEMMFGEVTNTELVINEIVLGYMKVKTADNGYSLIPVWDIFGYEIINLKANGKESIINTNDINDLRNYRKSYLTINAIDGSIIDRSLGY